MTLSGEIALKRAVKMLVMDVDGTLTDGKIHISPQGELFKSFDVKDGYGIHVLLPQSEIIPVVITGRTSRIVEDRCKELGIEQLYQGIRHKDDCLRAVARKLAIPFEEMACIGDDENDLPMMSLCGVCGCPADAVGSVKDQCAFVSRYGGGRGAVREFIEWLLKNPTL